MYCIILFLLCCRVTRTLYEVRKTCKLSLSFVEKTKHVKGLIALQKITKYAYIINHNK